MTYFNLGFFCRLLHQAALWDNAELLEDLLNGDEIKCLNSRDSWGRTALHAAATNAGSRCLRILAQAGADLDVSAYVDIILILEAPKSKTTSGNMFFTDIVILQ